MIQREKMSCSESQFKLERLARLNNQTCVATYEAVWSHMFLNICQHNQNSTCKIQHPRALQRFVCDEFLDSERDEYISQVEYWLLLL